MERNGGRGPSIALGSAEERRRFGKVVRGLSVSVVVQARVEENG